jgi:hypothetical protein
MFKTTFNGCVKRCNHVGDLMDMYALESAANSYCAFLCARVKETGDRTAKGNSSALPAEAREVVQSANSVLTEKAEQLRLVRQNAS